MSTTIELLNDLLKLHDECQGTDCKATECKSAALRAAILADENPDLWKEHAVKVHGCTCGEEEKR